ncbi:hypothetical protein Tco_1412700, partial [Tanacetum coccineum]
FIAPPFPNSSVPTMIIAATVANDDNNGRDSNGATSSSDLPPYLSEPRKTNFATPRKTSRYAELNLTIYKCVATQSGPSHIGKEYVEYPPHKSDISGKY